MDEAKPTLDTKTDLSRIEHMDWVRANILRFRLGKHPDPEIESLLERRMNLAGKNFVGPYPIRLLCTFAFVLIFCSFSWILIWSLFSIAGCHSFLRELSALMVTLLIALFGIAFSHPMKMYDERGIEKAGTDFIRMLRRETAEIESNRPPDNPPGETS